MGRGSRTIRFTCTDADTWYKVFDESDYNNRRIQEIRIKLEETSTADHFRYNKDGNTSNYNTSTSGVCHIRDAKKVYVMVPTTAAQVVEIDVTYK